MGTSWCDSAVISLGFSGSHRAFVDASRTEALFANTKPRKEDEEEDSLGPQREWTVTVIWSHYVTMVDNNRNRSHIAVRPVYAFLALRASALP
jgi:hypothetical protein